MRGRNTGRLASAILELGMSYDVFLNKRTRGFPFESVPLSAATTKPGELHGVNTVKIDHVETLEQNEVREAPCDMSFS
jgi:hypothetical protein